ncbi:MAG: hypothetical protein AAGC53_21410, partial [Actinomycetota bacterium]
MTSPRLMAIATLTAVVIASCATTRPSEAEPAAAEPDQPTASEPSQSAPAPSSGTTFDATLPDRGDDEWFFTGFTYYTLEQTEDAEFNAGF